MRKCFIFLLFYIIKTDVNRFSFISCITGITSLTKSDSRAGLSDDRHGESRLYYLIHHPVSITHKDDVTQDDS